MVDLVVLCCWLDLMILRVFSNLNSSMILWLAIWNDCLHSQRHRKASRSETAGLKLSWQNPPRMLWAVCDSHRVSPGKVHGHLCVPTLRSHRLIGWHKAGHGQQRRSLSPERPKWPPPVRSPHREHWSFHVPPLRTWTPREDCQPACA